VNGDYALDVLDIVIVIEHILDLTELTPEQLTTVDTNLDGILDILDVVTIVDTILNN